MLLLLLDEEILCCSSVRTFELKNGREKVLAEGVGSRWVVVVAKAKSERWVVVFVARRTRRQEKNTSFFISFVFPPRGLSLLINSTKRERENGDQDWKNHPWNINFLHTFINIQLTLRHDFYYSSSWLMRLLPPRCAYVYLVAFWLELSHVLGYVCMYPRVINGARGWQKHGFLFRYSSRESIYISFKWVRF